MQSEKNSTNERVQGGGSQYVAMKWHSEDERKKHKTFLNANSS